MPFEVEIDGTGLDWIGLTVFSASSWSSKNNIEGSFRSLSES